MIRHMMRQRWKTQPRAKSLEVLKRWWGISLSYLRIFITYCSQCWFSVKTEIIGMPLFDILSLTYFNGMLKVLVPQLCPTLCHLIDCSLPGFSAQGILQARTLEWIAILSSRDLPDLGIEPLSPASEAVSLLPYPPEKPSQDKCGFCEFACLFIVFSLISHYPLQSI